MTFWNAAALASVTSASLLLAGLLPELPIRGRCEQGRAQATCSYTKTERFAIKWAEPSPAAKNLHLKVKKAALGKIDRPESAPVDDWFTDVCAHSRLTGAHEALADICERPELVAPAPDQPNTQPAVAPQPVLRELTIEDFKDFPIERGEVGLRPENGQHTVNMPLIAWSTAREHTVPLTILGIPFNVRYTPRSFTFDYGDGSAPVVTKDPNAPFPDERFRHTITRSGDFVVSITTEWAGSYQIDGGPWTTVAGTFTTTVSSPVQQANEYNILLTDRGD